MKSPVSSASQKENVESEEEVERSNDEKVFMGLLKANSPLELDELKDLTGLSNKKWDKAIKGLTKNKLATVEKTEGSLLVRRYKKN